MTDKQQQNMEQILGVIKMALFPLLLTFVIYTLNKMDRRFDRWEEDIDELKINQRVIQNDINELKNDTNRLRDDVEDLKKNLIR